MLREKVISGSIVLTIRTMLGILISIVGNIFILRLFDLKTYGLYAIAVYWIGFLGGFVYFGINTYLARTQRDVTDRVTGAAFTLFLIQSFIGITFVVGFLGPLLNWFYKQNNFYVILCLLSATYLFDSFGRVSLSLLERDLNYRKLSIIELSSQLFYYIPAVVLALMGLGIPALIIGSLSKSFFTATLALLFKRVRLRFVWDKRLSLEMLKYGFGITTSSGIYCINAAIVPLTVGKIVGLEAVAIIRISQNIIGQLSFLKSIAWRISIPALGKVQGDVKKVVRAVSEGSIYLIFVVGLPVFGFVSIGYWLIPLFYGPKWEPVALVLVLASLPVIVNAVFSLQASALYAIGKNFDQAKWSSVYTFLLWPIAIIAVSRFGYIGLPLAEILVLPTYYVQHRVFAKHFGSPNYKGIFGILTVSYIAAVSAWFVHIPWLSLIIFVIPILVLVFTNKNSKDIIVELLAYFKNISLMRILT